MLDTMKGKRPGTTVTKRITNVRNLSTSFWRSMLTKPENRCLVPFTQFAEPKPIAGREECWFKVDEAPVSAFAGIWRPSDEGNVFAFLTCELNPLIKPIHPKAMPVILHLEDYDDWLSGDDEVRGAVSITVDVYGKLIVHYYDPDDEQQILAEGKN
jgi:putative SOS response-associated peptidase YedK